MTGREGEGWPKLSVKSIQLYENDVIVSYHARPKMMSMSDEKHTSFGTYQMGLAHAAHELEKVKTKGDKGKKGLSQRTKRKLSFYIANTSVELRYMITLTYPREYPKCGKTVKSHLNGFITSAKYQSKGLSYLWFLEFQKRGAPHFHILTNKRVDKSWVSDSWYKIVGSGDERHRKAGTRCETLRDQSQAKAYVLKYAGKEEQKRVPKGFSNVGRLWHCSRDIEPKPVTGVIEIPDRKMLKMVLGEWRYKDILDEKNLSTLYGASRHAKVVLERIGVI